MKKFLSAVCLCFLLLIVGLFLILPHSEAQSSVLQNLLDLPAPPPPNPLVDKRFWRAEDLFQKEPPSDDAPIEELLAYWEVNGQNDLLTTYSPKPSERTLDRILEEIEKKPEILTKYLNTFPVNQKYSDLVKRLYDRELSDRKYTREWRESIKGWLGTNSGEYSEELLTAAQGVKDTDEYVENQESLIALAKVDWEKARPIVERLLNDAGQPISQTLARWVAYQHATSEGNSIDAERYRKALQETVENKSNKPGNRDLAMDAIVRVGDFSGRDDWYFSLLQDESLYELKVNGTSYTGLTTLLNFSSPNKYAAKMIELAGNSNPTIRNAAVKNLATLLGRGGNPDVVKALVPWLENPKWAVEVGGERQRIVEQLRTIEFPESVPGLLAVLNEKATREDYIYPDNPNANTAVANTLPETPPKIVTVEYYAFRSSAVGALATQKDPRAVPALRNVLPETEQYERASVVRAILECNGFSIPEQVQALEVVAKQFDKVMRESTNLPASNSAGGVVNTVPRIAVNTVATRAVDAMSYASNTNYNGVMPYNPNELPKLLGSLLTESRDVSEELVTATVERIKVLETKSPKIATLMRSFVQNWHGKGINSLMLKDLKSGSADINSVVRLLTIRKELREKQNSEVYDIRGGNAFALGISACLLEDNNEYDALLSGTNDEAKTAMLGCAKLLRATLPINKVAENLKSPNKSLAQAAERFLESEDSPQSRQIVLSLHPNEAKILGAKTVFLFTENADESYDQLSALFSGLSGENPQDSQISTYFTNQYEINEVEQKLQKEVKENAELSGIYAYDKNFVRIYKDKVVFSWEEDTARYRERTLTKEEFGNLTSYLSYNRVDELPPFNSYCDYCEGRELLMLGKQGGRRVFVKGDYKPKFFNELSQIFDDMRKPPAKLHYWLEKYIAGLEVLFEDENQDAQTLWKNGDEIKLLVYDATRRKQIEKDLEIQEENEDAKIPPDDATDEYYQKLEAERQKRRKQREFEEFSWYKLDNGKLGAVIAQPAEVEVVPKNDGAIEDSSVHWKSRTANLEIRTDGTALYKIVKGQTTKIKTGIYYNPVITANGNWVVATKEVEYQQSLVRINLLTNKEFKLKLPGEVPSANAEVFVPALNKMLIFSGYNYKDDDTSDSEKDGTYYLLEVETGIVQEPKGNIVPLTQQTFRPLQPTANPNEFWVAINDDKFTEFGRYDAKLLKFKPLIKLPQIEFNSMEMFADEKEAKIYFVYEGHLLRIPLPK